ncbi:MAG: hypothetical protein C5B50_19940 [Verrucomicrobia bacterium]|nr:MAG: hypothetical protein C5B50_19940 [Verrucomicrobiota bacterium]
MKFQAEQAKVSSVLIDELKTPFEEYLIEDARQMAILDALEVRFGPVPEAIRARVKELTGESVLRRALRLAITESSLDRFLAAL